MGLAIKIKNVDFSSLNLGTVTIAKKLESISIVGDAIIYNTDNESTYSVVYQPSDTYQTGVTYGIQTGNEYASIDSKTGVLTVLSGANENNVTIIATSIVNNTITTSKQVVVTYHENQEEEWLNRLSELNCIFYAPLNNGDLTDHISGSIGEPYNEHSNNIPSDNLTWSDENNAYLLHTKYPGQSALRFPMENLQDRITNGDYITTVTKVKQYPENSTFAYMLGIGYPNENDAINNNYTHGYSFQHVSERNVVKDSEFIYVIMTFDGVNRQVKFYENTVERTDLAWNPSASRKYEAFISNWKTDYYKYITLCGMYGEKDNQTIFETQGYFKEAYVFNRILTTEEMTEIINHIQD